MATSETALPMNTTSSSTQTTFSAQPTRFPSTFPTSTTTRGAASGDVYPTSSSAVFVTTTTTTTTHSIQDRYSGAQTDIIDDMVVAVPDDIQRDNVSDIINYNSTFEPTISPIPDNMTIYFNTSATDVLVPESRYDEFYLFSNDPAHISSILVLIIAVGATVLLLAFMISLVLCCSWWRRRKQQRSYHFNSAAQQQLEEREPLAIAAGNEPVFVVKQTTATTSAAVYEIKPTNADNGNLNGAETAIVVQQQQQTTTTITSAEVVAIPHHVTTAADSTPPYESSASYALMHSRQNNNSLHGSTPPETAVKKFPTDRIAYAHHATDVTPPQQTDVSYEYQPYHQSSSSSRVPQNNNGGARRPPPRIAEDSIILASNNNSRRRSTITRDDADDDVDTVMPPNLSASTYQQRSTTNSYNNSSNIVGETHYQHQHSPGHWSAATETSVPISDRATTNSMRTETPTKSLVSSSPYKTTPTAVKQQRPTTVTSVEHVEMSTTRYQPRERATSPFSATSTTQFVPRFGVSATSSSAASTARDEIDNELRYGMRSNLSERSNSTAASGSHRVIPSINNNNNEARRAFMREPPTAVKLVPNLAMAEDLTDEEMMSTPLTTR